MGSLGRKRCFFLLPDGARDFRLATDLSGIVAIYYDSARVAHEPKAALTPAAASLKQAVLRLQQGDGVVSLSGTWRQAWKVESDNYPAENDSIAEVQQLGAFIFAEIQ